MKLFMTKKEKLAKKEELKAKRDALAKEYADTVKKGMEIEATKGEKFSWSYFQRAEAILEQITKLRLSRSAAPHNLKSGGTDNENH